MSAVWVVRDIHGEMVVTMPDEIRAVEYSRGVDSWKITRETLLTPAQAAVIAAAKVWMGQVQDFVHNEAWGADYERALAQAVDTLRAQEGE